MNFNERTNTVLYKNIISHTLFLKGRCWLRVRDEWRQGRTAILTQQYFFLILAGLLNRESLRAQSPLSAAGSQFGILSPTDVFQNTQILSSSLPGMISFTLQSHFLSGIY